MSADLLPYTSHLARQLLVRCNELMANRSRFTSKEEFALSVIQNIFSDPSLDLLLLKPHPADLLHADALNRLNGLIGFESTVFMTIYTNNELFNEFIDAFCCHCIRSMASSSEAMESIFMWLLLQYLQYLLPIDEQKLSQLKNSNWLSGPISSMPTSTVTSPRRLLRPEVLAASSPLEHISLRSGSFRTLYPRLLQFVGNLLNHLSSLSYWPSIAQFQVLKAVLTHYNEFILCETEDAEFSSLKLLLLRKPLFTDLLQNFLERLFKNWPLGDSYCLLIEIWMNLISPRLLHSIRVPEEKRHFFMEASSFAFIDLIQVQIRRLLDSGTAQMLETAVLDFLKEEVFKNEQIVDLFDQRGLPTVDYLRAILANLSRTREEIFANMNKFKTNRPSMWAWLFQWIFSMAYQPPVNMHELDRQIYELEELINWLSGGTGKNRQRLDSSELLLNTFVSDDETPAWNHSILRPEMPESSVDQWTKMLFLTPHGRLQVLNRQAKFDYSKYSKQISGTFPAIGYWDIAPLARFLHQLSIRWTNSWLVRYLRQHGRDSVITQMAAKALLNGPSPPRYVPVFARMVPKHEARLNLRFFANIPKLIYILFIGLLFFTFLFKMFI